MMILPIIMLLCRRPYNVCLLIWPLFILFRIITFVFLSLCCVIAVAKSPLFRVVLLKPFLNDKLITFLVELTIDVAHHFFILCADIFGKLSFEGIRIDNEHKLFVFVWFECALNKFIDLHHQSEQGVGTVLAQVSVESWEMRARLKLLYAFLHHFLLLGQLLERLWDVKIL